MRYKLIELLSKEFADLGGAVVIKGMQLPDKCCKCPILRGVNGMRPLIERRVVDPGKRHEACPLEVAE